MPLKTTRCPLCGYGFKMWEVWTKNHCRRCPSCQHMLLETRRSRKAADVMSTALGILSWPAIVILVVVLPFGWMIDIPIAIVLTIAGLVAVLCPLAIVFTEFKQPGDDDECPECQYSLRGNASKRCPECGLEFGPPEDGPKAG